MKIKALTITLLSILIISCKKEKSLDELDIVENVAEKSKVSLELDMIVPKDDTFQVYYTEDGKPNCSEENSVKVVIKGSEISQKILFELPEDKAINYIRIDIGNNQNQETLKVNNFTYKYFDKSLNLKGNTFFQYYAPNEFFTVDYHKSILIPTNNKKGYDAIMYALEPLVPALDKILGKTVSTQ